jgi:hypothetical protein
MIALFLYLHGLMMTGHHAKSDYTERNMKTSMCMLIMGSSVLISSTATLAGDPVASGLTLTPEDIEWIQNAEYS